MEKPIVYKNLCGGIFVKMPTNKNETKVNYSVNYASHTLLSPSPLSGYLINRLQKSHQRTNLLLKRKQDELNRASLFRSPESDGEEGHLLRKR